MSLGPYLEGYTLLASSGDRCSDLDGAVVFVCSHNEEGAMGIVVNRGDPNRKLSEILRELGIVEEDGAILLDSRMNATRVVVGGPLEHGRGFVLHTPDFFHAETVRIDGKFSLSTSLDVLRAIAQSRGPSRSVLALGYVQWGPRELEREIRDNGWLICEADAECVFGADYDLKYLRALASLGINDPSRLSHFGGRA